MEYSTKLRQIIPPITILIKISPTGKVPLGVQTKLQTKSGSKSQALWNNFGQKSIFRAVMTSQCG